MNILMDQIFQDQINQVLSQDLPILLDSMPADGDGKAMFEFKDGHWTFTFHFNSVTTNFSSAGIGASPTDAFAVAKQIIHRQIREWHQVRETGRYFNGAVQADTSHPTRQPSALIVDDDVDVANAVAAVFNQLGWHTEILTDTKDLHRTVSGKQVDFIILDWVLSETLKGSQVVERASRLIDAFPDMRDGYEGIKPKIITHSVLEGSKISFPQTKYFEHFDHWQKPIIFSELTTRASELMEAV